MPAATTCVKPSGTVSQLVDSASGVHPRYSEYYIRRYRIAARDPLFRLMKDSGIKASPENGQTEENATTYVLEFPVKSPEGCITRKDVTALDQLKHYKNLQHNWCEHNASMTVYVRDDEWFEVGNWVYKNWDIINGVSFLPYDGGHYKLAPYEEIDVHTYERLIKKLPLIDYSKLSNYETEDNTQGKQEIACSGDKCDI
jgi:ribonucleotide reductase alpha subunit